jgi:hypothetical protein
MGTNETLRQCTLWDRGVYSFLAVKRPVAYLEWLVYNLQPRVKEAMLNAISALTRLSR